MPKDQPAPDPRFLTESATRITGVAHAKLNLFLEILGRRADGYHELRTVFHEIDLADEISVELRPELAADELECEGFALDVEAGRNLALRAASAFRRHGAPAPPVRVQLRKLVKPGSGLGGGSADAAFVLAALRRLTRCAANEDGMRAAARELGADVGFFRMGGTAVGSGRGDELVAVEAVEPACFLLAFPDFALSTARVYAHADLNEPRVDVCSFVEGMTARSRGDPIAGTFNRLEGAAVRVEPRLGEVLQELRRAGGASWSMTGSGSALFTSCADPSAAAAAVRAVTRRFALDMRVVHSVAHGSGSSNG